MAKHQEQGRVGLEEEIRTSRRTKFPKDNIMLCAPFFLWFHVLEFKHCGSTEAYRVLKQNINLNRNIGLRLF